MFIYCIKYISLNPTMRRWRFYRLSSYDFIVIIPLWCFICHPDVYPTHQLLILLRRVVSCSILVHHIAKPSIFSDSQMLYPLVPISKRVPRYDRQNFFWGNVCNFYRRILLGVSGLCSLRIGRQCAQAREHGGKWKNGYAEMSGWKSSHTLSTTKNSGSFQSFSGVEKQLAELVAQFQFSNHRLFFCLFRALSVSLGGLREGQELPLQCVCERRLLYPVPIYGRQPC